METIEEIAERHSIKELGRISPAYECGFTQGYIKGATDQRKIDIDKACNALYGLANDLGCDLLNIDKAKEYIRKTMEE